MSLVRAARCAVRRAAALGGVALLGLLAVPASAATSVPTVPTDCVHQRVRPARIVIACADGNFALTRLSWTSWTRRHAVATGTAVINLCDPTCAGGRFASFPVNVELRRPRRCPNGDLQFHRALLTYRGRRPPGARRHDVVPLACPVH